MKTALTILLALASTSIGFAEESPQPWARFKLGTWKKMRTTMEVSGPTKMSTVTTTITRLVEVTATDYTLEVTAESTSKLGDFPPNTATATNRMTIPLDPEAIPQAAPDPSVKVTPGDTGTETLEIGGRQYTTTWRKTTVDSGGATSVVQTWLDPVVPGHDVRSVTEVAGPVPSRMVSELVEFRIEP